MVMGVSSTSRVSLGGGIGGGGEDDGGSPYVNVRLGRGGQGYDIETASVNSDDDCCGGCKQWWTKLCKGVRDWFARGASCFTQAHMRNFSPSQSVVGTEEPEEDIFGFVGQFPKPAGGEGEGPGDDGDVTYATLKIGQPQGGPHRHEGGGDGGTIYSDVRTRGPRQSGGGSSEPSTRF